MQTLTVYANTVWTLALDTNICIEKPQQSNFMQLRQKAAVRQKAT